MTTTAATESKEPTWTDLMPEAQAFVWSVLAHEASKIRLRRAEKTLSHLLLMQQTDPYMQAIAAATALPNGESFGDTPQRMRDALWAAECVTWDTLEDAYYAAQIALNGPAYYKHVAWVSVPPPARDAAIAVLLQCAYACEQAAYEDDLRRQLSARATEAALKTLQSEMAQFTGAVSAPLATMDATGMAAKHAALMAAVDLLMRPPT